MTNNVALKNLDDLSVATVRTLSIDSVEHANHGHLGMPLGAAPMGYKLYHSIMKHNPKNPSWFNRDRFVLSAGHGSVLQYVLLHLSGYDVSISDLKEFRRLDSITPGHPEYGVTPGVEATTGPLGQGIPMSVGMAIAERHLASKFNTEKFNIVDHYTYSICGDGDLMEGVGQEAMSLAGHLQLGKLILLYDSNDVVSDGEINDSNSENVQKKYEAMGWQTILVKDGNDLKEIEDAIKKAKKETNKPSLIEVKTVIGFGSPNLEGTSKIHSNPIGKEEEKLIKNFYSWEFEDKFIIPEEVKKNFEKSAMNGLQQEKEWQELLEKYNKTHPDLAKEFKRFLSDEKFEIDLKFTEKDIATRSASGKVLNEIAIDIPVLIGGSADLASSNKTIINNSKFINKNDFSGSNIHFGIREFSMAGIINGLVLHSNIKAYSATFLVFSDYMKSAIRMAAIMKVPSIFVFTHDSIMLGQDGPTHQPIEHLISLRAVPNLNIIRPCDANEVRSAWEIALNSKNKPTAIILGRHNVPILNQTKSSQVSKGAYVLSEITEKPEGLLISTGSEIELCLQAQYELNKNGVKVNVISMPSWELFEEQSDKYKESVLPHDMYNKLAVEMGSKYGWRNYIGEHGDIISIDSYGESGDGKQLAEKLGFSSENIVERFMRLLEKNR